MFRQTRMLRNYYINREWIVSTTALRIYCIAAVLSLGLFFGLIAIRFYGGIPRELLPAAKALLFAGVVGAATTTIAMEYFLFGFDTSSAWKRAFWFCVILLPPVGPALYCFIVYSRSAAIREGHSNRIQIRS